MTVTAQVSIGPADPESPTGEWTVHSESDSSKLKSRPFEDGTLWEIVVQKGAPWGDFASLLADLARRGVMLDVFNPADMDQDDPYMYIMVWEPAEWLP